MWLKAERFIDKVMMWWDSHNVHGYPCFVLVNKLKALKVDLKKWKDKEFGYVVGGKNCLLESIQMLNVIEDKDPF